MPAISTIQFRRDTAANWTSTNPTLAAGEVGFETVTNKFKIGTGALTWTALGYAKSGAIFDYSELTGEPSYVNNFLLMGA